MSISTRKLQVLSHLSKLDNQLHMTTRSSILNKNLTDFFGCSEDCMLGGETKKKNPGGGYFPLFTSLLFDSHYEKVKVMTKNKNLNEEN